ncbi:MAG: carboxypeptidase-like regulatory domain-containing protein [Muribaculaceae bacterium]|nr:carboxypeptidase-like regulatory domain-containing protein [Muribaculaceae bacterium]
MYRLRHYIFLVLMLVSTVVEAKSFIVSGKVIDESNEPMEFVSVRIAGTMSGGLTNEKGLFSIEAQSRDTAEVIISYLGYETVKRRLIEPEGEIKLNVRLYQKDRSLDEVSVREFRKQTTTLEYLDADDLRLMPDATGGSIESLLTTMPGVHSNNELSTQYSVRGGNYDENLVYINGIEVYRPLTIRSGQQEGLSIINPDLVGSVGFSSGGFASEYGDKMSSVLDITYRKPKKAVEGAVSGSLMGASVSVGSKIKNFTQLHGFRFKKNSLLLGSLETKGEYDPSFIDYQTYMTYKFNNKWSVSLLGNISQNKYNFTPQERTTTYGTYASITEFKVYFDGMERDKFQSYFGAFTVDYTPANHTKLTLMGSGFTTNEEIRYDISGEYWLSELDAAINGGEQVSSGTLGYGAYREHANNKLNAAVYAATLKGVTKLKKDNELHYGVTYQYERIKDRVREWETRDSAGYTLPHTGKGIDLIESITSHQDMKSNRISAYIQDTYRLRSDIGNFTFTGGVRASYWDFNNEFLISPRASVAYIPSFQERLTFRFSTGVYYQAPFYKELRDTIRDERNNVIVKLDKNIKSQQSIHFILGSDFTFKLGNRPFKLTAEAYYKILNDLIPYEVDNLSIWYRDGNSSHGYATGLDLKLFGEFVPGVDSWIGFSLMSTQEYINGIKVPRPTDQRYAFTLFFQDYIPKFPRFKVNLRAIVADGLPQSAPRKGREDGWFRTPAYKRLDIGASCMLAGGSDRVMKRKFFKELHSIWLSFDVLNLLDITNVNSYYWVTDIYNQQSAVPNYLTRRQFNVKLSVDF